MALFKEHFLKPNSQFFIYVGQEVDLFFRKKNPQNSMASLINGNKCFVINSIYEEIWDLRPKGKRGVKGYVDEGRNEMMNAILFWEAGLDARPPTEQHSSKKRGLPHQTQLAPPPPSAPRKTSVVVNRQTDFQLPQLRLNTPHIWTKECVACVMN